MSLKLWLLDVSSVQQLQRSCVSPADMATVDKLIEHIGDFGVFQKRIVTLGSFPLIIFAFVLVGVVFLGHTPDHWCRVPGSERLVEECGWTEVKTRDATVPRSEQSGSFSSCEMLDVDWSKSQSTCDELARLRSLNGTRTVACDGRWTFAGTRSTTVSEVGTFRATSFLVVLFHSTCCRGKSWKYSAKNKRKTQ